MDFVTYQRKMQNLDRKVEELKAQIRKLKKELDEAEAAKESAIKFRGEFNSFISRRKKAKNKPVKNPLLKAFKSFAKKADTLLTGDSYHKTADKVDEMKRVAERKIRSIKEDITYCEKELRQLVNQQNMLTAEYKAEKARQEAQQA